MEKFTNFQFKGQYFQSGECSENIKEVWFVLHGYGQLAKYFIRKFDHIASAERLIIAPGGLSKFYLEGFNGRVGATWMTKEDRLIDIDNYVSYLNQLYLDVLSEIGNQDVEVHFLGFSQGAATVTRWLQWHKPDFKRLIIWAGSFPYDMDIPTLSDKLKGKEVIMVRGTDDPLVKEDLKEQQLRFIEALAIQVTHISFNGKHEIDTDTLIQLTK